MPRGFTWCAYVTDGGVLLATLVDSDYALDPDRGWFPVSGAEVAVLPRGFRLRHVRGIDESGAVAMATVAHLGAALWTGFASTFVFNATDGAPHTAVVFELVGERAPIPRVD